MDSRDNWHWKLAPKHSDLLECVGVAVRPVGQAAHAAVRTRPATCHARHIKPGTEAAPLAR